MKKVLVFSCAIIVLSFFLANLVYSQSLEDIKARARAEVRSEMGLDKPEKRYVQQVEEVGTPVRTRLEIMQQGALILMVVALIPATVAKVKGRSFIAWWVLGLIGFIAVFPISIFMKKLPKDSQGPKPATEEKKQV